MQQMVYHVSDAVVGASVPRIEVNSSVTGPRTVAETHVQAAHACTSQQQIHLQTLLQ